MNLINFAFSLDDIKKGGLGILRTVIYSLDQLIYEFIIQLYNFFKLLCNGKIASDNVIGELAKRIGLILGIVMFFYVTFDFIQILIDPDKIQDKEKGPVNIIKKFIVVIVLLGTSSFIFNFLYNFQVLILSGTENGTSVFEKIILPYQFNTDNFGYAISANFMKEFYKMNPIASEDSVSLDDDPDYKDCKEQVDELPNRIISSGSLSSGYYCLNARFKAGDDSEFYVEFSYLSVLVGGFVVWTLIMYCISVGMRIIQLTVLQIISPVAIVSYLSPKKDGMFGKFWKVYFSTYIDVFIRVAIIDFIVLLSGLILDMKKSAFWTSVGGVKNMDSTTEFWLGTFMILALLSFAKKAPDLIKKFLPESASGLSLGISSKDRAGLGILGGALAGGVTGVIGGVAGGKGISKLTGAFTGAIGGVGRGLTAGAKGKDLRDSVTNARKNQATANLSRSQRIASGQSWFGSVGDTIRGGLGIESGNASDTRDIQILETYAGMQDTLEGYADNNKDIKRFKRDYEATLNSGRMDNETQEQFNHRVEVARKKWTTARENLINNISHGYTPGQFTINYTVDGTSYDVSYTTTQTDDKFTIENVTSTLNEMDRMHKEHKNIFRNYESNIDQTPGVNNYNRVDNNVQQAKRDISSRRSMQRRTGKSK